MPNRKKRLKKGIESIKEEIEKHKQKRASAISEGDEDLSKYYDKEIRGMESQIERKKEIADR
jgi:phage shock protein A